MVTFVGGDERLYTITFDRQLGHVGTIELRHRIDDLLHSNKFAVLSRRDGPYRLHIMRHDDHFRFNVVNRSGEIVADSNVQLASLGEMMERYVSFCGRYDEARPNRSDEMMEAIDMGRTALHDEGAQLLMNETQNEIATDLATARKLFSLLVMLRAN